jgi:hypothetical protein
MAEKGEQSLAEELCDAAVLLAACGTLLPGFPVTLDYEHVLKLILLLVSATLVLDPSSDVAARVSKISSI